MKVYFVGAGPGDPELLTVRAQRLLAQTPVCVYAGSLVSPQILATVCPTAEMHDSAAMHLEQIEAVFRDAARRNLDVVRLHTGEPSIYGAIGEQMDMLDRLGIDYEQVPGVSAFQAAAAALRVELTAPEVAQTIILTRAPGRTPMPPSEDLAQLAESRATLCIFLSVDRIDAIAATLAPTYGHDCPAAVVYHASWPDQQVVAGSLEDIAAKTRAAGVSRTAMLLVGRAIRRPLPRESRLYDKGFTHGYRKEEGA